MYINKSKLSHILQPDHYRSEEFYQTEQEKLFKPGWHLIGSIEEIPKDGDFMTYDLFGHPMIVRNYEGEVVVFLNVCGHRHCRLTDEKCGNSPTLKCQYHGWEYKKNGFTGKIPDAQCFKPFDRENTRLEIFRSKVCGGLIFVALEDDAPEFETFFGKFVDVFEDWFGSDKYHFGVRMTYTLKANWKVSNENTLESYHVPHVHGDTIGDHPKEEDQEHEIGDYYSSLYTIEPETLNRKMQDILIRLLGWKPSHGYTHHMVYPNIVMLALDPMAMTQTYIPTSRNTHRWEAMVYFRSAKGAMKLMEKLSDRIISLGVHRVVAEDIIIFDEIQVGLEKSRHPGVLGTIEERVFAFQEYMMEKCEGRERESSAWEQGLNRGPINISRS